MHEGVVILKHDTTKRFRAVPVVQEYNDHINAGKGYQCAALWPGETVVRLAIPEMAGYEQFPDIDLSAVKEHAQ